MSLQVSLLDRLNSLFLSKQPTDLNFSVDQSQQSGYSTHVYIRLLNFSNAVVNLKGAGGG